MTPEPRSSEQTATPGLALGCLHLAVLWSFAVAKPLFDVLSDDPTFFIARDNTSSDIVVLTLGLVLIPPALLLAIEAVVGAFSRPARRIAHLLFVALLASLLAIQLVLELIDEPAAVVILISAWLGAGFAAVYASTRFLDSLLTILSPAPALFAALFLLSSPVSDLVNPPEVEAAPPAREASGAPVVVIVFDEFPLASLLTPGGEIDASRYPNFARLAADSNWYRGATTVAAFTHLAVPAILDGRRPRKGIDIPTVVQHPDNLFTRLEDRYRMKVVEPVTRLCPETACGELERDSFGERIGSLAADLSIVEAHKLAPKSLAEELPALANGFGHFVDPSGDLAETVTGFPSFVEEISARPRTLYFFHAFLPHVPWQMLPGGHAYPDTLGPSPFTTGGQASWVSQPLTIGSFWARHLLQAGYADHLLGELIDRMQKLGIWDEAVVAVVADHGAAFVPGVERRRANRRNIAGIAPVPMFIKGSGQTRGAVITRGACNNEVMGQVLNRLGVHSAPRAHGCSRTVMRIHTGGPTRMLRTRLQARLARLVRHQTRLFGSGDGWSSLYEFADDQGLIGRPVEALPVGEGPQLEADASFGQISDGFPEQQPVIDILFNAEASDEFGPGDRIAVAVDGRVRTIAVVYQRVSGDKGMVALLPPGVLAGGEQEDLVEAGSVELFRIRSQPELRLEPVALD